MGDVRDADDLRVRFTNRRCDYCGVFEGMPHSTACTNHPELREKMATAIAEKSHILKEEMAGALAKPPVVHQIHIPLPPECEQYAPEISRFVEAMVYKLKVHAKKGKWEKYAIDVALAKLDGEVLELREAVAGRSMVETLLEAADVANYALIIAAKGLEK